MWVCAWDYNRNERVCMMFIGITGIISLMKTCFFLIIPQYNCVERMIINIQLPTMRLWISLSEHQHNTHTYQYTLSIPLSTHQVLQTHPSSDTSDLTKSQDIPHIHAIEIEVQCFNSSMRLLIKSSPTYYSPDLFYNTLNLQVLQSIIRILYVI